MTISPESCISVRNLSTSFKDSVSRLILTSPRSGLDPRALRTFFRTPDADLHGREEATADSISWIGSVARYLNFDREIFISFSWIILDPPLPETPELNSLQFRDSYKIQDLDWLNALILMYESLSPDFFDVAVMSCPKI